MPVYNEKDTIETILDRVQNVQLCIEKEIIMVDDFSTDGTRDILATKANQDGVKVYYHPHNMGKGASVRTALEQATGDIIVIQDADLEYDPNDFPALVQPTIDGNTKVVYGSRFLVNRDSMMVAHTFGNKFLTAFANVLYGTKMSDMETCYKVFTADVNRRIKLQAPRWGFDPELTAQILKQGHKIYEVPISYHGRQFLAGKKISWRDGFVIMWTLLRYRFSR
jgi:glycosyltransferase involved in cell wall biosynthesis